MSDHAKELYRQLRSLPWERLWEEEAARFNRASPDERVRTVAVIRAVGVVFSESGRTEHQISVQQWLQGLLRDPAPIVRRYAMAALPKIGAGAAAEESLLSVLRTSPDANDKRFVGRALEKIGGAATLNLVRAGHFDLPPETERKIRTGLARQESPSALCLDRTLDDLRDVRIQLRTRRGLEEIVRDEVAQSPTVRQKFRVAETTAGLVTLIPVAPFSLPDINVLRCFDTVAFLLADATAAGNPRNASPEAIETLARLLTSPLSRRILEKFTRGTIRYRLNFIGKGHQRAAVCHLADRVYALCPALLNDGQKVTWTADIFSETAAPWIELRPNLTPDPRFVWRGQDVPAASHPPLAACLARIAGRESNEVIWDPFCGSGSELIECAFLGGVPALHGTDLSPTAIAATRNNFIAANVKTGATSFTQADFRDFAKIPGLEAGRVSLILTNPPMGMRVPVPNLRGLIGDLFKVAATVLRPGGRLVLVNPVRMDSPTSLLRLQSRRVVDMGGFEGRMEVYRKTGAV